MARCSQPRSFEKNNCPFFLGEFGHPNLCGLKTKSFYDQHVSNPSEAYIPNIGPGRMNVCVYIFWHLPQLTCFRSGCSSHVCVLHIYDTYSPYYE